MAALAAGLAGGCGETDRDRVNSYIADSNAVQKRAEPELARANRAYMALARGRFDPARTPVALARAETAIRRTRTQLARIEPPAPAERLHRELLHAYDLNAALAGETARLGHYLPAAGEALEPLEGANRRLRRGLAVEDPDAQARALGAYSEALRRLQGALRRLEAPPVLEQTQTAQIARFGATRRLALSLRDAVATRDARRVATLLRRFRRVGERGARDGDFDASALRAYGRRYERVRGALADVERERLRLEQELG